VLPRHWINSVFFGPRCLAGAFSIVPRWLIFGGVWLLVPFTALLTMSRLGTSFDTIQSGRDGWGY